MLTTKKLKKSKNLNYVLSSLILSNTIREAKLQLSKIIRNKYRDYKRDADKNKSKKRLTKIWGE